MVRTESSRVARLALLFAALVAGAAAGLMLPASGSADTERTTIEASGGNILPSFRLSGRGENGEIEG